MLLQFDKPGDPAPMTARVAVARAIRIVNIPSGLAFVAVVVVDFALLTYSVVLAVVVGAILFAAALAAALWWWSFVVPRWRSWAITRGADPLELQRLGEDLMFLWPQGSIWQKVRFLFYGRGR